MKRTDFFSLIKSAVAHQARPLSGLMVDRLQSFAVIRSRADVSDESGGRSIFDTAGPYFFSRKFENTARMPANIANEMPGIFVLPTTSELPNLARGHVNTTVQLICLFPSLERALADKTQKITSPEDIEIKAIEHLDYVLQYVRDSVFAEIETPGEPNEEIWANESYLNHLEDAGTITLYNINHAKTQRFQRQFLSLNEGANIDYVDEYSAHKLCGALINLVLPETSLLCGEVRFETDFTNC